MTQCQVCGAKTDAYLCRKCCNQLREALRAVPDIAEDLALARTRRTRVYRAATSRTTDEASRD